MCIQWTRVLYSVVLTRQSNPPISQFNSPCNEFTGVWSMFVYSNSNSELYTAIINISHVINTSWKNRGSVFSSKTVSILLFRRPDFINFLREHICLSHILRVSDCYPTIILRYCKNAVSSLLVQYRDSSFLRWDINSCFTNLCHLKWVENYGKHEKITFYGNIWGEGKVNIEDRALYWWTCF